MTQEEKNLLLVAICGYLPYALKMQDSKYNTKVIKTISFEDNVEQIIDDGWKPYLRPLSSMTEEDAEELKRLNGRAEQMDTFEYVPVQNYIITDWLNRNHFDYCGLIEKGLAIEVTEENNPYKEYE